MESITRTIPVHVIHGQIAIFNKETKLIETTEISPVTQFGGETMTDADALKVLHKVPKLKGVPVVVCEVEHSLNVYSISLEDFMKYATNEGAPKAKKFKFDTDIAYPSDTVQDPDGIPVLSTVAELLK